MISVIGVIPADERVKKSNVEPLQDARPSFPRRRESISTVEATACRGTRLRGYDAAARISRVPDNSAIFFTRSNAGIHASKRRRRRTCLPWAPVFTGRRCGGGMRERFRLRWRLFFCFAPSAALAGDWIADGKYGLQGLEPAAIRREAARWSGPCKDGFADGKGVLDWLKGDSQYERDEGVWHAGRQTGEGAQTWPGGQYKGQFADSLPHGKGVLISGEARYDGAFLNGKPNGKGVLTNASGTFDGIWSEGCFNDGKRRASFGVSVQSCP